MQLGKRKTKIDSLDFCRVKIATPVNCLAESPYQIKCDDYSMAWLYLKPVMLPDFPEKTIRDMETKFKGFSKTTVKCYLLNGEAKGCKIRFTAGNEIVNQLLVYGEANGQAVFVQLVLKNEPRTSLDIPELPRRIIRLAD